MITHRWVNKSNSFAAYFCRKSLAKKDVAKIL